MQGLVEKVKNAKGIFFFHLPKTGGSYAAKKLQSIAKQRGIPLIGMTDLKINDQEKTGHRKASWPHGPIEEYGKEKIPDDYLRVTIARDPVSMITSDFQYRRGPRAHYNSEFQTTKWWMLGRRPPFCSLKSYVKYFTDVSDFLFLAGDADSESWCYTFEPGRARIPSLGKINRFYDSMRTYSKWHNALFLASLIRPVYSYSKYWVQPRKDLILGESEFFDPGNWQRYPDIAPFSYFYHYHDDGQFQAWRVFPLNQVPAVWLKSWSDMIPIPTAVQRFCMGNLHLAFYTELKGSPPTFGTFPVFNPAPQNKRQIKENEILCKNFEMTSGVSRFFLPYLWEYCTNPFHLFFKPSGECNFDLVMRQEDLDSGLTWLAKNMDVNHTPSERVRVTDYENQDLDGLKKAYTLSGYDTTDMSYGNSNKNDIAKSADWTKVLDNETIDLMTERFMNIRNKLGYKTSSKNISDYSFENPVIDGNLLSLFSKEIPENNEGVNRVLIREDCWASLGWRIS